MLSCHDCARYLDAFLDSELGVKESLDIQAHMSACTACADHAEAERRWRAFVRQHATVAPLPQEAKRRMIRQAMLAPAPASRWRRLWFTAPGRDFIMGMATAAVFADVGRAVLAGF